MSKTTHQIKLIAGQLRHRTVTFPEVTSLRPTANRIRETLFNWLGQDLTGKVCLDLFAGSGALGFEAASRSAKSVIMIEKNKTAYHCLQRNQKQLNLQSVVQLYHQAALTYLHHNQIVFDIIFVDPPFHSNLLQQTLPLLKPHVENGFVYVETPQLPTVPATRWVKKGKAGQVEFGLMQFISS